MKAQDLTGPALDWVVAQAQGYDLSTLDLLFDIKSYSEYRPSTDWAYGGPILEKEVEALIKDSDTGGWYAGTESQPVTWISKYQGRGPTALIAAMRCFCESKLGKEVEVPEEFLS